jgi:hypothetical protein
LSLNLVLNLILNLVRFIYRAGSFEQVATVSALDIKCIPADFIIIELDIGRKDCASADALMRRTNRAKVRCLDRW